MAVLTVVQPHITCQRGIKDVLVLEADDSIRHGGSSKQVVVFVSPDVIEELPYAMYAVNNMWRHFPKELGVDVEYYQRNLELGALHNRTKVKPLKSKEEKQRKVILTITREVFEAKPLFWYAGYESRLSPAR